MNNYIELNSESSDSPVCRWAEMYEIARRYYLAHGDLAVSSTYVTPEGERLGVWLNAQRRIRAGKLQGCLTDAQIRALDAIGMSWIDLSEEHWNRNYRALRAYYEQYGNLDIPLNYVTTDGVKLGYLMKNMRFYRDTKYRRCLTPERIAQLDEMGMIWDMREHRWQRSFEAARAYYEANGNLAVSRRYVAPDGEKLGAWLDYQRKKYAKGELSADHIALLDAIGMIW